MLPVPSQKRQHVIHAEELDIFSLQVPPTADLEFAYVRERNVFFLQIGLNFKDYLFKGRFKTIWNRTVQLKKENVLTKIVARGNLHINDNLGAILLIGDYGARSLLFYSELEGVQAHRRRTAASYSGKNRIYLGSILEKGLSKALSTSNPNSAAVDTESVKAINALKEEFR